MRDCTRLKKLTGENKGEIFTIDPKNIELSEYRTSDIYELKEFNNIYSISGSSMHPLYTTRLYNYYTGRVYNKKISINYINKIIQNGNQAYRQRAKDAAIEEQKQKMEINTLINQEFGKSQ